MRLRAEAAAIDRARGAFAPALYDSINAAAYDAWFRGLRAKAIRTVDAAVAAAPLKSLPVSARPYTGLAQVYALAGAPDRARAMLAAMDAAVRDSALLQQSEPGRKRALGFIALDEKRPLDAVRLFRAADSLPDGPANPCAACTAVNVGMGFDQADEPDSAIAAFRRYLETPYWSDARRTGVPSGLRGSPPGRVVRGPGRPRDAATYYQKFVDLWKNADPELQPQVADVKKRLNHLRDTEKRP